MHDQQPQHDRYAKYAYPGIEPVDGWTLCSLQETDGDGFHFTSYFAVRGNEQRSLNVSRFRFSPSQARFAFLARNGFPHRPGKLLGPWDDTDIEMALAVEAAETAFGSAAA